MKDKLLTLSVHALHGIDMNDVWLQQDDAKYRSFQATVDFLRQTFHGRLNS